MKDYLIATASTSDLPLPWLEAHHVPFISYTFTDGKSVFADDCREESRSDLYQKMRAGARFKTSMINEYTYAEFFRKLLSEGKDVIYLDMTEKLSVSYENSIHAAETVSAEFPDRRFFLMDTRCVSGGLGLLVEQMDAEDMHYPLHLGVTEAGEGEDGRIKSALGIGALLTEGIGDTIRVSLSEEPEAEIPVARKLVSFIAECTQLRREAEAGIRDGLISLRFTGQTDWEDLQLKCAMAAGAALIDRRATKLSVTHSASSSMVTPERLRELEDSILQAARIKFTKTEYISCPGCGRTLYNLQDTIRRVKAATSHLAGLKIGIMGCIVNGPGEMADADYGYVGAGRGKISLYRGKECVEKSIPEAEAVDKLLALIGQDRT